MTKTDLVKLRVNVRVSGMGAEPGDVITVARTHFVKGLIRGGSVTELLADEPPTAALEKAEVPDGSSVEQDNSETEPSGDSEVHRTNGTSSRRSGSGRKADSKPSED